MPYLIYREQSALYTDVGNKLYEITEMKGAVLIIGSLLWENKENSLNRNQGELRENWRKELDINNKFEVEVPIRYGRKSSSRRCTYTMIFSNSVSTSGKAYLAPYKEESHSFEDIKKQAIRLAKAEGISTNKFPNRLIASWGAVGIAFNKKTNAEIVEIKNRWHEEFVSFDNTDYKIGQEKPSILRNGELNFEFVIPDNIDYVFATPVIPNVAEYPSIDKIASAILESNPRYDTYLIKNIENGIRVKDDDKILEIIK